MSIDMTRFAKPEREHYEAVMDSVNRLATAYRTLRDSRDELLAAAKRIVANDSHGASDWAVIDDLKVAISKAEATYP